MSERERALRRGLTGRDPAEIKRLSQKVGDVVTEAFGADRSEQIAGDVGGWMARAKEMLASGHDEEALSAYDRAMGILTGAYDEAEAQREDALARRDVIEGEIRRTLYRFTRSELLLYSQCGVL